MNTEIIKERLREVQMVVGNETCADCYSNGIPLSFSL